MQNKVIEWYTHNSLRRFPVSERANLVSDLGVELPNALIVDGLYHSCLPEVSISTLQFIEDILTVKLSDGSYFSISPSSYTRYSRVDIFDKCGVAKGLVNLGDSVRFLNDIFGSRLHTFSDCLLESSFVYLIEESVTSIGIPNEVALTGDVNIRFGSGVNFREDGNNITIDTFNNLNKDCNEEFQQPLLTINGISPDANGVLHLGVGGIITKEPIQNGLAIGTVIEGEGAECLERLDPASNGAQGDPGPQGNAGPRGACAQVKAICCLCEQCNTVETCATCETCNTCEQCNTCETCNTCEANDGIITEPPIPEGPETENPGLCPDCIEVILQDPVVPDFPIPLLMEEIDPETDGCEYVVEIDLVEYRMEYSTDRWIFTISDVSGGPPFALEIWESIGSPDTALSGPYSPAFTFGLILGLSASANEPCPPVDTGITPDFLIFDTPFGDPGLIRLNKVLKNDQFENQTGTKDYDGHWVGLPYVRWSLSYRSNISTSPFWSFATWPGWELVVESFDDIHTTAQSSDNVIGRIVAYRQGNIDNILGEYAINFDFTDISTGPITISDGTPNDPTCTEYGDLEPASIAVPEVPANRPDLLMTLYNILGDRVSSYRLTPSGTEFWIEAGTAEERVRGIRYDVGSKLTNGAIQDILLRKSASNTWDLIIDFNLVAPGTPDEIVFQKAFDPTNYTGKYCNKVIDEFVAQIPPSNLDDDEIISHAIIEEIQKHVNDGGPGNA